jgi:hypothetical protein
MTTDHNELSVIAEDEEPSERIRPSTSGREIVDLFLQPPMPVENIAPLHQDTEFASTSHMDIDTFYSIPLNSSVEGAVGSDSPMLITSSGVVDSDGSHLPEHQISSDRRDPPADQVQEDNTTAILLKAADKTSFPTLPEPMPLRKSTRLRDPSMNTAMHAAATPGATTGKRTSWLAKAREVKALEGNGRKLNAPLIPSLPASNSVIASNVASTQGTKRKSEKMLVENDLVNQEERVTKIAKMVEGDIAPRKSKNESSPSSSSINQGTSEQPKEVRGHGTHDSDISEGVLDMLKKTVQGLGVRTGKTMGKSLGGDAATALAEAKAAAEARVAERDRRDETTLGEPASINSAFVPENVDVPMPSSIPQEGGVSLLDLFPKEGRVKEKHKAPEKVFHKAIPPPPAATSKDIGPMWLSTSTTPPNSPPSANSIYPAEPVFTKLTPVFIPPTQVASKPNPINLFTNPAKISPLAKSAEVFGSGLPLHKVPSSMVVGVGTKLPSPNSRSLAAPLTAQSTFESVHSETIFDHDDTPAWMPSTQDTEYTSAFDSQSQPQAQICDEDDSWPLDDKLAAGVQWTYGVSKEDSMTWSTMPSQSQRADTGPIARMSLVAGEGVEGNRHATAGPHVEVEEDLIHRDQELEEIVLGSKSTVNLVKVGVLPTIRLMTLNVVVQQPELTRTQSQSSMATSESSQSHTGFFGQASKFLTSALGTGKKKPEVKKVLQMAAVAAKKVSCGSVSH